MVVYLLQNTVNGKCYVGKTVQGLRRRWNEHCGDARSRGTTVLHRALRKYGPENFQRKILSVGLNESVLLALETFWIRELNTRAPNGYNLTDGGDGISGCRRSPETRAKQSAAARNRSPELIEKMRVWGRTSRHTPEYIESIRERERDRHGRFVASI